MKPFKKPIYIVKPISPKIDLFLMYFKKMVTNNYYTNNGEYTQELELLLKEYLGVKYNAIFGNGTTALMIALKSLNLTGSVITTPFTFPATANVLNWLGLSPIFCDIDYDTMNMAPQKAGEHLDNNVSAILPVHMFGQPCDVKGFEELAKFKRKKLVYDAAHAFGVKINGKGIGNFGDITMFSFHATKLFHTSEGGMLTYGKETLDTSIKQLRNFGIKDDITGSVKAGINGKMSEMSAIMGLTILRRVKEEKKKRRENARIYMSLLKNCVTYPALNLETGSNQYFPVRFKEKRNEVYEKLIKYNVFPRKYFYPLCSDFTHYKHLKANVPIAKKVSEEILCLPFYGDLKRDEIEKICEIINTI